MWTSKAEAEGLTLLVADNKAGYYGVHLSNPGYFKPYQARVWRGGKKVSLGMFATAEEAALSHPCHPALSSRRRSSSRPCRLTRS